MSSTTRSTLQIDAVAQAAAGDAAKPLLPHPKLAAIAGLAGFVLHWFRRSVNQVPARVRETGPVPAGFPRGSRRSSAASRLRCRSPRHPRRPAARAAKGGGRHA